MPGVELRLDGYGAFAEFAAGPVLDCGEFPIVATLDRGTTSGRGAICFALRLPSGGIAFGQTGALAFFAAVRGVAAKFPKEAQEAGIVLG